MTRTSVEAGVKTLHPQYVLNLPKWLKVDNLIAGNVKQYLREVGSKESDESKSAERQKEYEDGAILDNFSQKTLMGLAGAAFMKSATVELQTNLEYLEEDVDGTGTTLEQQAKEAVEQDLRKGRFGLMADMPRKEDGTETTIADNENGSVVPRITRYYAEDVINWRYRRVGSAQKLELVVLQEKVNISNDIFGHDRDYQYRVLALDGDGIYYQQVYDKDLQAGARIEPRQNGQLMTEIPFFFVGVSDNTATVDASPLYPIVELNIGHYRNSADTEENSFICSQAMLILSLSDSLDLAQWKKENPEGVQVGSRRGLNVGAGGDAKFIQAAESDKAMRLMEMKKKQAVELGAQIITPSEQVTAETARIQQSVNHSVLSAITSNVTAAYRDALTACAAFLGTNYDSVVEINQDFYFSILSAQDKAQWVLEIMQGVTPRTLYYNKLRESGEYPDDWTDEMIREALEEEGPVMTVTPGMEPEPPLNDDAE